MARGRWELLLQNLSRGIPRQNAGWLVSPRPKGVNAKLPTSFFPGICVWNGNERYLVAGENCLGR